MRQITLLAALIGLLTPQLRAAEATLRPGDTFDLRLTGMPLEVIQDIANLQYSIGPDGTVNIPYIGKVKASGLNATQLEESIQTRFITGKIFTRPTVIININQVARFVSITGGVRGPGRQQWTPDMTLGSAIGAAGGLDDFTSGKGIQVIREGKIGGVFNFKDIRKDPANDPKLLPGDQVVIPQ